MGLSDRVETRPDLVPMATSASRIDGERLGAGAGRSLLFALWPSEDSLRQIRLHRGVFVGFYLRPLRSGTQLFNQRYRNSPFLTRDSFYLSHQ